jgi:P27 family predicted phage terminase small subunit
MPKYQAKKGWSKETKRFWHAVQAEYDLTLDGIELLRIFCNAKERAMAAQEEIDRHGVLIQGDKMLHRNPATLVLKEAELVMVSVSRALGIGWDDTGKRRGRKIEGPEF